MTFTHGSLFSGILGFELGAAASGFETLWCSEIEKFCNKIIALRAPGVPNLGDVTQLSHPETVDVLSFGSPCQDLSVAGRRKGLEGSRSGLFFEAARIIDECRPTFAVWENVAGAFSSNSGRDFAAVLDTLRDLGAHDVAWRVFDSQYAGVPQQRRRVYLVADFRGERAGEVLFEPEGCGGHPAPGGTAGQDLADTLTRGSSRAGVNQPGRRHEDDSNLAIAKPLGSKATGGFRNDLDHDTYVVETHGPQPGVAYAVTAREGKGVNSGVDQVSLTYTIQDARAGVESKGQNGLGARESDTAYTLDTLATQAVAFQSRFARNGRGAPTPVAAPLTAEAGRTGRGDSAQMALSGSTIRRFSPLECERLQGFPDGWTCLCMPREAWKADPGAAMFACNCPDGPRYRAIGNAVTTTVPMWIFGRIATVLG